MQQNILLYSEAKTARPFWWSSLDFWVVWAFSRLTTSEDWPFWPLRGLKGQISRLSASLRSGQHRNLARQPKKSCCFSSLYNKIPFPLNTNSIFVGNNLFGQFFSFRICQGVVFSLNKIYCLDLPNQPRNLATLWVLALVASQVSNAKLWLRLVKNPA